MSDTLRSLLLAKIDAATTVHPALQVLSSNGSTLADMLKAMHTTAPDVIGLTYQGQEPADEPNEDGSYSDGSPEWRHSYLLTYKLGIDGLSDDDATALAQAIADYFNVRRNARLTHDGRVYTVRVLPTAAVPSADMSYNEFQIPITVG